MTTAVRPANQNNGTTPLWRLVFGIIDQPVATFKEVQARQRWVTWALPLLLLMAAFMVVTITQIPYIIEAAQAQAEQQLAALPPDQAAAARSTMEFTLSLPVMLATSLGFGLLALLVGLAAQATFLYFGSYLAGGDEVSFGSMFTMNAWARLPMAIGYLVQAVFVVVSQGAITYPGLAFLVSTGDPLADAANPMFVLLSSIDLFWLWHLLLVVLGLTVAARLRRGLAITLTLVYAAVVLGITILPSLVFGSGFGG